MNPKSLGDRPLNARPVCSVVMPTYNDSRHLAVAIESILDQNFRDFEFVIVDDCSTDKTFEILEQYRCLDTRIKIVRNAENLGVARSLNKAIALTQSPFIARMDGDDISLPTRLEKQLDYMQTHPAVGVLGTQSIFIDEQGRYSEQFTWSKPTSHNLLVWHLLYTCPFCHPSVMMRADAFRQTKGYDPAYSNEDMQLWTQMMQVTQLANLDEVLVHYRMSPEKNLRSQIHWEPYIKQVGWEYARTILGKAVDKRLVDIFVELEKYEYKLCAEELSTSNVEDVILLLDQIFSQMRQKGAFTLENLDEIENFVREKKTKVKLSRLVQIRRKHSLEQ